MTRTCKRCSATKPIEEFHRARKCVHGRRPICKACSADDARVRYTSSKNDVRARMRARYAADPEKFRARTRYAYATNPEYRRGMLDRANAQRHSRYARMRTNPVARLANRIRTRLRRSMRVRGITKMSPTFVLLGYAPSELCDHLTAFVGRACPLCRDTILTLDNAEIDHVVPLCHARTEADVLRLNALRNLRMLCRPCNQHRPRRRLEV